MRIKEVQITGYKSFESIELKDLGKVVILIGKNSAGKSNLLEVLEFFFRDLDALPPKALGATNEHLWHGFEVDAPIKISVRIEMDPATIMPALPSGVVLPADQPITVQIERSIVQSGTNMEWRTTKLELGNIALVENNAVVKPEAMLTGVPTDTQSGAKSQPMPADAPQKLLQAISQSLLARFQVIPAARTRQLVQGTTRSSLLDDQVLGQIQTIIQLTKAGERRRRFNPLQRSLREIVPSATGISAPQAQVFVQEDRLEVPFALVGGGVQEVVNILVRIQSLTQAREGSIIGIEEPELLLHPGAIKLLLRYLYGEGSVAQFWVTTHSPFMVDMSRPGDVWLISKVNGSSEVSRLDADESLRVVLGELGVKPSDLLFADAILIVEGPSDVVFYRGMAHKMGFHEIDFVGLIPAGGHPNERRHLKAWGEDVRRTGLPVYLILDADAHAELSKVTESKLIDQQRSVLLTKGALEDAYPTDKLLQALKEEFGLEISPKDLPAGTRTNFLEKLLHEKGADKSSWKVTLASKMVDLMEATELPDEVTKMLLSIKNEIGLSPGGTS